MQSFETRMRRASKKTISSSSSRGAGEKRRTRQRQPIQCGLLIIILSSIVVLLLFICSSRIYSTWSLSNEIDIELSTILTTKEEADEREVNNKINNKNNDKSNKLNLRPAYLEDEGEGEDDGTDEGDDESDDDDDDDDDTEEEHKNVVKIDNNNNNNNNHNNNNNNNNNNEQKKILVLWTKHGNIRITLRPDLSQGSVDYIHKLVESYGEESRCMHCNLYRSEKPGILQGIMENKDVVPVNTVHGPCPSDGVSEHVANDCPEWDKNCGCHGPVMTRGSVAWAAGDAGGPDFFIDGYKETAKWWGTQHTNFGTIEEENSFKILDFIFTLPTTPEGGLDFLNEPIHFDLRLE
jgi:hypothetical protein